MTQRDKRWECSYFIAYESLFRRIKTVECLTQKIKMTEESCNKIFIRLLAIDVNPNLYPLETLKQILNAQDYLEFVYNTCKEIEERKNIDINKKELEKEK